MYEKEKIRHGDCHALSSWQGAPTVAGFPQIPYSTISSWRKLDYSSYLGHEYRFLFEEKWDVVALRREIEVLRKQLRSLARAWLLFKDESAQLIAKAKRDTTVQKKLLACADALSRSFEQTFILRLLQLKCTQLNEWRRRTEICCPSSELSLCLRRFPNQLSKDEVRKIKALLHSSKFQHWPIVSIAAYAQRKGFVLASLFSWYKYARMLHLQHKIVRRAKQMVGLVATAPNEYWHADTTYYSISDTKKICITIVMDNYSKMILGFSAGDKLCFSLVKEAIARAHERAMQHSQKGTSFLVTDGGRENDNQQLHTFLQSLAGHRLHRITALRDIQFSNSPIEAIHKILKGRYLRNQRFASLENLICFLNAAVQDYNSIRPHCGHGLRTPE